MHFRGFILSEMRREQERCIEAPRAGLTRAIVHICTFCEASTTHAHARATHTIHGFLVLWCFSIRCAGGCLCTHEYTYIYNVCKIQGAQDNKWRHFPFLTPPTYETTSIMSFRIFVHYVCECVCMYAIFSQKNGEIVVFIVL